MTATVRPTGKIIYEVTINYVGSLTTLRQREPTVIFFSNLRKAVDAITAELALNNWPPKVNYTAVYRGVKQRDFYSCDFTMAGLRVFRLKIVPRILNPALPRLGIDENPAK
ncbi:MULTISPECIES: hypothetical protein [unclassified Spirosoma]|uniref:hypothetical protein n=1 Tax=unclassified Spirosoma TaxID=2621999 RepID=UPI0009683ACC|nr:MULTISPECIES: hypothetical protein [unclassified Spirosoma]MBN8823155.1 hypothetical protein [Spirosoma sp.]OJW73239.1 MAG: hypothetical protein BGO59_07090 [Spirosoma sp. 48-14]